MTPQRIIALTASHAPCSCGQSGGYYHADISYCYDCLWLHRPRKKLKGGIDRERELEYLVKRINRKKLKQ